MRGWVSARRAVGRLTLLALLGLWLLASAWEAWKPLAPGTRTRSNSEHIAGTALTLMPDITAADAYGRRIASHAIFDSLLQLIGRARELLVLDLYRFNDEEAETALRPLATELRDAIIERRRTVPGLRVVLLIDPGDELYGARPSLNLRLLRAAGVDVVYARTRGLRSPNPAWTGAWALSLGWWLHPHPDDSGRPSAEDAPSRVPPAAWMRLLAHQSDRRSVALGDDGEGHLTAIVGSLEPAARASGDSNLAVRIEGTEGLRTLLASELALARFSGWQGSLALSPAGQSVPVAQAQSAQVQLLTEGAIRDAIVARLLAAGRGVRISIATSHVADRVVIDALLDAARRGAEVRVILDANREAFGHLATGLPNQPVASELVSESDGAIKVRWYRTHGERFHANLVMVSDARSVWLTVGSADLTRPALGDYNLCANAAIEAPLDAPVALQALEYFDSLWTNRAGSGIEYTADFAAYADPDQGHYWLYRLLEASGLAGF